MQAPFLVVAGPAASESAIAADHALCVPLASAGWRRDLARPGLSIWVRPERPAPITWSEAEAAAIIGRRYPTLAALAGSAVAARGGALCRNGWGSYLAVLEDPQTSCWWGLRDPSGAVEAFTWRLGPLSLTASTIAGLPPGLLPNDLGLDWRMIADFLRRPATQIMGVALHGIHALGPGDLHPLGANAVAAQPVWRPVDFSPATDGADASWAQRLADTASLVTARMLSPYDRVVTELSGGFDSAVVNAALALADDPPRIAAALHYVGDRREADEQPWARIIAGRHGLPLQCIPRASGPFDPEADFAELSRDVRPPFAALDAIRDRDSAARIVACGAKAVVTGKGGDGLFFQMPSVRVLSDLWRARGLAALCGPHGPAIARWLRRSVWSVWREALSPAQPAANRLAPFVTSTPVAPHESSAHPWLEGLEASPPGKRLQIEALVGSQAAIGQHRRSAVADVVQPLMSQPLMELCLSVPTWELVRGGRDRGLAREAFRHWLPPEILTRRSKGALTSVYSRRAAAGADALRTFLVDGVLADAGLLDRDRMRAALQPDHLLQHNQGSALLTAAALESWVRYWQTRVPDCPAGTRPRW